MSGYAPEAVEGFKRSQVLFEQLVAGLAAVEADEMSHTQLEERISGEGRELMPTLVAVAVPPAPATSRAVDGPPELGPTTGRHGARQRGESGGLAGQRVDDRGRWRCGLDLGPGGGDQVADVAER